MEAASYTLDRSQKRDTEGIKPSSLDHAHHPQEALPDTSLLALQHSYDAQVALGGVISAAEVLIRPLTDQRPVGNKFMYVSS